MPKTNKSNTNLTNTKFDSTHIVLFIGVVLSLVFIIWYLYQEFNHSTSFHSRVQISRLIFRNSIIHLLLIGIIARKKVISILKQFFLTPGYSGNLAIFRIFFFWMLFKGPWSHAIKLSKLPAELHNASWQLPQWFFRFSTY